jgi:predicted nucleic acid-binding Zn ribbon protein
MSDPSASAPLAAAPASAPGAAPTSGEPTHGCVRCGRAIPLDRSMCETCNPLGLEQPATSQVHGTAFIAIIVGFVILAVAARAALSGVGPFRAQIVEVLPVGAGLQVTLEVANDGSRAGSTTCQLTLAERGGLGANEVVLSPEVEPGESRRFATTTDAFGGDPVSLAVVCQDP